ncbi:MAG: SnoaL-like domain-containing protein [Eudoraea sp.]|nr:SnoaL-like domain-containing protein [Eudoraea sp.]
MKTKLFGLALLAMVTLFGCKEAAQEESEVHMEEAEGPDYADFDRKVAVVAAFYEAHSNEDLAALTEMLSDTMQWSPPAYNGNEMLGKEDLLGALKAYHDGFEDIKYTSGIVDGDDMINGYWSGSVFPETDAVNIADVIRVYGTWHATYTETGNEIGLKFYSLVGVNEDGKIISASDYFDAGGLMAQATATE